MKQKVIPVGSQGFFQIFLIIIILLALGGIFFLLFLKTGSGNVTEKGGPLAPTNEPVAAMLATPSATTDPSLIIGWKSYTNADFGFSLKYPKEFAYLDNGSASSEEPATTSAQLASDGAKIADKVTFTDSNKKSFTLNLYNDPLSSGLDVSLCGKDGNNNSKPIYKTGSKGENLVYFCIVSPKGNAIVLRNSSGSTEIAMKLMLSTIKFEK